MHVVFVRVLLDWIKNEFLKRELTVLDDSFAEGEKTLKSNFFFDMVQDTHEKLFKVVRLLYYLDTRCLVQLFV